MLDRTREGPLSDTEREKLRTALHVLAEKASSKMRTTEKTRAVVKQPALTDEAGTAADKQPATRKGHGRIRSGDYTGAGKVIIRHADLKAGDACPECTRGKVYAQREPKVLVKIVGQAPLAATVYEMERLRCNGCGQVFTAAEPEGIDSEKYDATATAIIAQLKYGINPQLWKAIHEVRLVRFKYKNRERIVEPHDYGIRNGIATLLASQVAGSSSHKLPNWRWMEVERISGIQILNRTFPGGRSTPTGKHHKWDKLFIRVKPADNHAK